MAGYLDTNTRLTLRNQTFLDAPASSKLKSSEKFAVSLRKYKRQISASQKRTKTLSISSTLPSLLYSHFPLLSPCSSPMATFEQLLSYFSEGLPIVSEQLILKSLNIILCKYQDDMKSYTYPDNLIGYLLYLLSNRDNQSKKLILEIFINSLFLYQNVANELLKDWKTLLELCRCDDYEVSDNAIWCMANLAGTNEDLQQRLLNYGVLDYLAALMTLDTFNQQNTETCLWAIRNFTSRITLKILNMETLHRLIRILVKETIDESTNKNYYCLTIISNLAMINDDTRKLIMNSKLLKHILHHLQSEKTKNVYISVQIVSTFLSSNIDDFTQVLLNHNILELLSPLLYHTNHKIRTEVYTCFGNIVAGTYSQMQSFLADSAFAMSFNGLKDELNAVRHEALALFSNLSKRCTEEIVKEMCGLGFFKSVSEVLNRNQKPEYLAELMSILEIFLQKLEKSEIEESVGSEFIESVRQLMANDKLSKRVEFGILESLGETSAEFRETFEFS